MGSDTRVLNANTMQIPCVVQIDPRRHGGFQPKALAHSRSQRGSSFSICMSRLMSAFPFGLLSIVKGWEVSNVAHAFMNATDVG